MLALIGSQIFYFLKMNNYFQADQRTHLPTLSVGKLTYNNMGLDQELSIYVMEGSDFVWGFRGEF